MDHCTQCNALVYRNNMDRHFAFVHAPMITKYGCEACPETKWFTTMFNYRKHYLTFHFDLLPPGPMSLKRPPAPAEDKFENPNAKKWRPRRQPNFKLN